MPANYQEQAILRGLRAPIPLGSSDDETVLRFGRVLRAGERTPTDAATYWDVVVLSNNFENINLNSTQNGTTLYDTAKQVRPYLCDCMAEINMDVGPDDLVLVKVLQNITPGTPGLEETDYSFDLACVGSTAKACIVSMLTSERGCQGGTRQGWRDVQWGGLVVSGA